MAMALMLFVVGIIIGVYSPWVQEELRLGIVHKLNEDPDTEFRLGHLRLNYPLKLDLGDMLMVEHGDTTMQADRITADVRLLPLLDGRVNLVDADLTNVMYRAGSMDSASCVTIRGNDIRLASSTVDLATMGIHVSSADLDSARVNLFINPVDTFPVTPPSEPSRMKVRIDHINYRSLTYEMESMPTIYKLSANIEEGALDTVSVDLYNSIIDVADFRGHGVKAQYLMPDSAQIKATEVITNPEAILDETPPWTINVRNIDLTQGEALYATYGIEPEPGMDFEFIQVSDLDLSVRNLFIRGTDIDIPLKAKGHERCGIDFDIGGNLGIDSTSITLSDFMLKTPTGSDWRFTFYMNTETDLTDPITPVRIKTDGYLSVEDIEKVFPSFKPYFIGLRNGARIDNNLNIEGVTGDLNILTGDLNIDSHINAKIEGNVKNIFDPDKLTADLHLDADVTDVSNWTNDLLADTGVIIPVMTLKGNASFGNNEYAANIVARTGGGELALKGYFNGNKDGYDVDISTKNMPVNALMPALGIGKLTSTIQADGHGFDFFKKETTANVDIKIDYIEYLKQHYKDLKLTAHLADNRANVIADSGNPGLDLHLEAEGDLVGTRYNWEASLRSDKLDLAYLGITNEKATISTEIQLKADFTENFRDIDALLDLKSIEYITPESTLSLENSTFGLVTCDTLTNFSAQNGDLYAFFSSPMSIEAILKHVDATTAVIDEEVKHRNIDIPRLQKAIMPFSLDIESGMDNVATKMLEESDIGFERLSIIAANDSNLTLKARIDEFRMDDIRLDSISLDIDQIGNRLNYIARVDNKPGTFDEWAHVLLTGYLQQDTIGINLCQRNIEDKVGFDIGACVSFSRDSTITLHFEPYTPVINYIDWTINEDNFVTYDVGHKHLDANLRMKSELSRLALYTEHAADDDHEMHNEDEDLILQLFDIRLQDWIALDPFAPPVKGDLSAGLRVNWKDKVLNGTGTIDLSDVYYGKDRIGDFNLDLDVLTDTKGFIRAEAGLWYNSRKMMTIQGALNDTTKTAPVDLAVQLTDLPLEMANPFLPDVAKLSGYLDGGLRVTRNEGHQHIDGYLAFDNANINVTMLGSSFNLNQDSILVKDNILRFDNFRIKAVNDNPLTINGKIDISKITSPDISLDLKADNMQLVGTNRAPKGADVYGKAFVGLNSTVRGSLDELNVNATVNVLPGTNLTYILAGGAAALETQSSAGMVKFVNFTDSTAVAAADSVDINPMKLNLNAILNVQSGTILNVDLGTNVQDRVQLQGSGTLTYTSSPFAGERVTGRYTLSGGYVRYAPPLISNINFAFTPGSYVAFTGTLDNPQFNIKAIEKMRANVSQAGQNSRLIYFDIILTLLGNLDTPKIAFDLATDDDVTVANELASMSPTQRESEAINLLLYNTYTGGSTKATSNLNGNPLFSFLTNSVNSWLANNVRGVDLSIGVNQYDQTVNGSTSLTTSYSYQVSKSLLNDRIKIVVGGSYSDDPNENGNIAENLINDISFEYYLNNARTMYLKLFRHTGYESILEGEITQTGGGFVYKKRINRLRDMFVSPRRRKKASKDSKINVKPDEKSDEVKTLEPSGRDESDQTSEPLNSKSVNEIHN